MAGLPWVKVATDFVDHPKAVALGDRLGDPRAPLHLPPMWGYFARRYPAGAMPDTADAAQALERAVLWRGESGQLVATLVEVGLLERRRGHLHVHDWIEWQEAHARKLERDRNRMRAKRAERQRKSRATVAEQSSDGSAGEEMETERRGDREAGRPARVGLGELGAEIVSSVCGTDNLGDCDRRITQQEASELEHLIVEVGGVQAAITYFAGVCRERSSPTRPYLIRSYRLVLEMLRSVAHPALRAGRRP